MGQLGQPNRSSPQRDTAADVLNIVRELAAEVHPRQPSAIKLDSSLERDVGLDSLSRVELVSRIERRFAVTLPEQAFSDAESPRDLWRSVLGAHTIPSALKAKPITRLVLEDAEKTASDAETLVDVLERLATAHPGRLHIQLYKDNGDGEQVTYASLAHESRCLATGLQRTGLQPGDRVAIMLPTGKDYFFAFYGTMMAGGVPVPIYPPARLNQIEDHLRRHRAILENCGTETLITIPEAKPFARLLRSQVQSLQRFVTVQEISGDATEYEEPRLRGSDIAFLQYTSGSTGIPKGTVLTHANLLANIRAISTSLELDDTDVAVSWLPLYHDMGLIGACMCSLYNAFPLVLLSPLEFLSRPERWLWAIHRYRGTLSAAPNFAYDYCLRKLKDADLTDLDLSSWRISCNGAEPVSPDTIERFSSHFAQFGFRRETMYPVYGLAESSLAVTFPTLGHEPVVDRIERDTFLRTGHAVPASSSDDNPLRFVSCGQPLPGHEARVVDGQGRELPERQDGRLQFRGPSATSGYFRNVEATGELFSGDWLDSGDRAYVASGSFYITGRTKDVIIRAGRNIYPAELEEAVGSVSGVRRGSVAAFGLIDSESGRERLVVVAETRERDSEILERMRSDINAVALELTGIPADDIVLAPPRSLLKTSSGKIRRRANRELYERGQLGAKERAAWWQITKVALISVFSEPKRWLRGMGSNLFAGYAWLLFGVVGGGLWLTVLVLPRLEWRWAAVRHVARFLFFAAHYRIAVSGLENVPSDTQIVFVANHASYVDSFVLAATLPQNVSYVAKIELTETPPIRAFLNRLNTVFVERFDKQRGIEDARRIATRAKEGHSILFFPEGRVRRIPGLQPFQMGAFVCAADAGLPVIPIALRGTRSILRPGTWFPRPGVVSVTIGHLIHVDKPSEDGTSWDRATSVYQESRNHILRYCGEPDHAQDRSRS